MANGLEVPDYDERAFLCGMTGSGKTTLAEVLLRTRANSIVVHDGKDRIDWFGFRRCTTLKELQQAKERQLIYAPAHHELIDTQAIEDFFQWVYYRQNTTLYVDEVGSVTNRGEIPIYYHACLTRGRQLGISTLSATQRPKMLPQVVMSESEKFYIFRLQLPQDRSRVEDITGVESERIHRLQKREFIYATDEGDIIGPCRLDLTSSPSPSDHNQKEINQNASNGNESKETLSR